MMSAEYCPVFGRGTQPSSHAGQNVGAAKCEYSETAHSSIVESLTFPALGHNHRWSCSLCIGRSRRAEMQIAKSSANDVPTWSKDLMQRSENWRRFVVVVWSPRGKNRGHKHVSDAITSFSSQPKHKKKTQITEHYTSRVAELESRIRSLEDDTARLELNVQSLEEINANQVEVLARVRSSHSEEMNQARTVFEVCTLFLPTSSSSSSSFPSSSHSSTSSSSSSLQHITCTQTAPVLIHTLNRWLNRIPCT